MYLGIDGGNSGTRALLIEADGTPCGYGTAGNANHQAVGIERAMAHISAAMHAALSAGGVSLEEVATAAFSVAGCDLAEDEELLTTHLRRTWPMLPFTVSNDVWAGLRAGSVEGDGVAVNCGTGTGTVGRSRAGQRVMIPDLGYLFGDSGGGMQIAHDAFHAISRADDGRGAATALSGMVLALTQQPSVAALRRALYYQAIGDAVFRQVTPLVFRAAADGDGVACVILEQIGDELGVAGAAVARRLGLHDRSFPLVLTGGAFRTLDSVLATATIARVRRDAPLCVPTLPQVQPVGGAALLALDQAGIQVTRAHFMVLQEQGYGWPLGATVA